MLLASNTVFDDVKSIGFALDPSASPAFLLDWELTKKCNLDCSYCDIGVDGGHDNSTNHPLLDECLKSIDFMYEYVSLYMQNKKLTQRKVILNMYGGESLFHPNIVEILLACREKYKAYTNQWELTITTTTNAVINKSIWDKIIPLVDEFTVSYHAENLPKQQTLFFENLLRLKQLNKRVKCVVMMHNDPILWKKSLATVEFCQNNEIRYVAKPFDNIVENFKYSTEQFSTLKTFWINKINPKHNQAAIDSINNNETGSLVSSICEGRACCGGRKLSLNNDLKSSTSFVPKQGFQDWYCSVNWFFLYVQQVTGNVYVNRDCKMRYDGTVGPIGNISDHREVLSTLRVQLDNKSMPVIQCAKSLCLCGYCAPKAEKLEDFKDLISRNVITDVIKF